MRPLPDPAAPEPAALPGGPAPLASDAERDAAVRRLQDAFAERRLDDQEFDHRARLALTARTRPELDHLLADLPAPIATSAPALPAAGPGRMTIAYKNRIRRAGRWTVPAASTTVVYKGDGLLDLRAAILTSPVTTITAVGYKSDITILVPPGSQIQASGLSVSTDTTAPTAAGPVFHVRGFAYKGAITVTDGPPAP